MHSPDFSVFHGRGHPGTWHRPVPTTRCQCGPCARNAWKSVASGFWRAFQTRPHPLHSPVAVTDGLSQPATLHDGRPSTGWGLVAENGRWEHAGQRYFDGEVEPCINGRTIQTGAYFGVDVAAVVGRILAERLADGGWNCQAENGSVRSSFDTTINVLDGLLEFEHATGGSGQVRTARRSGEEYLLERGLFRRKSTGAVVQPAYLEFAFPYYWHYDVLRALDYFRRSGADPDPRMAEAVAVVQSKRQSGGWWLLDRIHPGRVHFDLEGGAGTPSRWNTLRALRVLKWWDGIA
jgi:hypothetical protein